MIKTKVVNIHSESQMLDIIEEAAELIREGGLVVYPTESCYGLGCNALDKAAVKRVFAVKRRPLGTALPIIVSDVDMLKMCAFVDDGVEKLMEKFWPGPLTIALRKKPIIPDVLNPRAVAARISSHPVALSLVKAASVPITATSANTSGKSPHYAVKQLFKDLDGKVDLVLDSGRLPRRRVSTIVDFTFGTTPKITRIGAIPEKDVSEIILVEVDVR